MRENLNSFVSEIRDTLEKDSFPTEVFRCKVMQRIFSETRKNCYNADYSAGYILPAFGTQIGNSCKLRIKSGYEECAIIYSIVVGNSGSGKSTPSGFAQKPFFKKDKQNIIEYNERFIIYEENQALKKNDRLDIPKPKLVKTLMSDFTIESVAVRHLDNPNGLWIHVDEIPGLFGSFGKYSQGQGNDQQVIMQIFSQQAINKDRVSGGAILIEKPHVCISGGIQTKVFEKIFKSRIDDGMMARFLIFKPTNQHVPKLTDDEMDVSVNDDWARIMHNITYINGSPENPFMFEYSAEAWEKVKFFINSRELSDNEAIASIDAKLNTYVHRLALILHVANGAYDCSFPKQIPEYVIDDVILLYKYFRNNAVGMLDKMEMVKPYDKLSDEKKELFTLLPDSFTRAQGVEIAEGKKLLKKTAAYAFFKNKEFFTSEKIHDVELIKKIVDNGSSSL
ncbi:hypothetical protein ASG31_17625 [Chryseobacterium sp. Leaf404]|uniref:DUF3987 domain-containing protein n=1 Tax=unclassified Chryseobacterium TaxID=2593645 RepID=UPI0006F450AE|nr:MULTISPECIES: DUF3987 domain-containing protein [unclassified Chryseobacterium]KQT20249.1 hypothetical protein ASG31_17625 [Chryseobacterium sp. Leaf404]